jgi:TetR/AcrR family transcriptional regulator, cholesterol catabolism regulator
MADINTALDASKDAMDQLIFVAHVRTLLDDIEGATAHLQTDSLPPALRTALVRKRDRYEQALRRVITEGVRSNELVDLDPAIVVRAMLGAMNWTVTWFRPDGADTADVVGDVIARFLVRGVAARTPAARRTLSVIASPPSTGTP